MKVYDLRILSPDALSSLNVKVEHTPIDMNRFNVGFVATIVFSPSPYEKLVP